MLSRNIPVSSVDAELDTQILSLISELVFWQKIESKAFFSFSDLLSVGIAMAICIFYNFISLYH